MLGASVGVKHKSKGPKVSKLLISSEKAANGPADDRYPEIQFEPSGEAIEVDLQAPPYNPSLADRRRNEFMTMKHTIKEKMELYTSSTKGKLLELKEVLDKADYSVTEEISKSGYYWTVLHYASHYGHYDIL